MHGTGNGQEYNSPRGRQKGLGPVCSSCAVHIGSTPCGTRLHWGGAWYADTQKNFAYAALLVGVNGSSVAGAWTGVGLARRGPGTLNTAFEGSAHRDLLVL